MVYTNFPNGATSFGIPLMGAGPLAVFSPFGNVWFVDSNADSNGNDGTEPSAPFKTMEAALDVVGDNDVIYFVGTIREQLVAPLGVTGVRIVGVPGGNVRDDGGAKWYAPATPVAGQALLELREQGWELHNFLMSPDTTSGACVKAHRNEDATYPDSSHFILNNMRFVGTGGTTYGVQDVGGNHHYIIQNCEFQSLTTAIYCSSTAIAVPLRNTIRGCKFYGNTNDISTSLSYSILDGNRHFSDNTVVIDTVANSSQGGNNVVTGCNFPNAATDIDPAHGYTGASTDLWEQNFATDQAVFGQPA